MYHDFLRLNDQLFKYAEDSIDKVSFTKVNILTNYDYFPVLPRDLYSAILKNNIHIPYNKRGEPLQLIGKVSNVLQEIEDTRSSISRYINNKEYERDSNLVQGFKWLRRTEVLYYDIFTLQEKLHWKLTSIIQSFDHPAIDSSAIRIIEELQPLLTQTKFVIKSIRAEDNSSSLTYKCLKLKEFIRQIELRKIKVLTGVEMEPNSIKSPEKRFEEILLRTKNCLKTGFEYKDKAKYQNREFNSNYYYYNNNLLDNYNRSGDGIATLFNKFIEHSGAYWLFEHEMPHMFEVLYPDFPEFEQYQTPDIDIDQLIKEALLAKSKKDSMEKASEANKNKTIADSIAFAKHIADSIEYRKNNPERGDLNLTGFATNNLVFLLDISSSMKDSNKLPLLKNALKQLLDLMRPEDNITFITYSGKAHVLLKPTSAQYKDQIISAIDNLSSGGTSDADQGIHLAYKTIEEHLIKEGNNRIIMATEGAIKVNNATKRLIKKHTKDKDKVCMSVFYFSQKEYSHHKELLEELSASGQGKYSYIQKENAQKILLLEAQTVRSK